MSLPDYYFRFNPDLLALIPPDAKVVLEIGCGAGALCEAYRRVNPGVHWFGVELNVAACNAAIDAGMTDCFDTDAANGPFLCEENDETEDWRGLADCLVLGDILEHLNDPWATLKSLTDNELVPGAQVLASIPNVQHWTVIRDLLAGKWEYQDEGLLDRTHLRFFTLDSIRAMFDQAGLHVFEIRGRDICNDGFESWVASNGVKPTKEMRAYQYIVRAVKPCGLGDIDPSGREPTWEEFRVIPKLHIHAITAEECCARPRIHEPFAALRTVPGVTCTTGEIAYKTSAVRPISDIMIQQRFREFDDEKQHAWREQGSLLIAELDDEPEAIGVDPMALRAVHAVQVSTEPLAEIVRKFNPNVMVFPNQIAELPKLHGPIMDWQTSIFYGAQNRESDWAPIMPALNRIIAELGNKLEFQVICDKTFFDALETTEKTFTPFCEYSMYRQILGTCDIALLPLEPGRFNECKSELKALECFAEGVVVLAGETVYSDYVCHPLRGHTYYDESTFEGNLRFLINRPDVRTDLAAEAYSYVRDSTPHSKSRMLGQHFRKRLAWYQELLRTKPELDRELFERVPELARSAPVGSPA